MKILHSPALEVVELSRTYGSGAGEIAALRGLSLAFGRGTFTAVMGPSGSGKSTLLACAAGIDVPTTGTVRLAGEDLTGRTETERARLRRDHVGLVLQSFGLLDYLTAEQNVALPLRLAGQRPDGQDVRRLLDRVGLGDRGDQLPATMSGGQQQRVAIARALVSEPDVLLADEPTGALDQQTARSVLALMRSLVDTTGQTLVMVTHDPVAASYADAVVFLVDGQASARMTNPTADAVAAELARLDVRAGAA